MSWDEDYENDWDDDQTYTVACPNCGHDVYEDAEKCPHCGEYIVATAGPFASKPVWFQKLMFVIAILTLIGLVLPILAGWLR